MRETIRRLLREEGQKNDPIQDTLFKYWDKNGPSIENGKYFSLSEKDTSTYLIKYHGDNIEELITDKVKELIENYHSCDGDEFDLRFDSINFGVFRKFGPSGHTFYNVTFSIDQNSAVFYDEFDFEDYENLMTLYGQIEECIYDMLNNTVYITYGVPVNYCTINGVYDSNI